MQMVVGHIHMPTIGHTPADGTPVSQGRDAIMAWSCDPSMVPEQGFEP